MDELRCLEIISDSVDPWPVCLVPEHKPKADLLNCALASLSGWLPACSTEKDIRFAAAMSVRAVHNGVLRGEELGVEAARIRDLRDELVRRMNKLAKSAKWN